MGIWHTAKRFTRFWMSMTFNAVAFVLIACDSKSAGPSVPAQQASLTPKPAPQDKSLDISAYIKAGMPSPERDWLGADVANVAEVVKKLPFEQLPRFESARSGAVFARMTSASTLTFFGDKTFPLSSRMASLVDLLGGISSLNKSYLAAFEQGKVGSRELIELSGCLLHVAAASSDLIEEFLPSISKDDPNRATRMKGFEQMRGGLAEIASGSLTTLTERSFFPVSERLVLLDHLRQTLPSILPRLSNSAKLEIVTRVEKLAADDSLKEMRPGIQQLKDAVSNLPSAPSK